MDAENLLASIFSSDRDRVVELIEANADLRAMIEELQGEVRAQAAGAGGPG